jgi:hypothetical protein
MPNEFDTPPPSSSPDDEKSKGILDPRTGERLPLGRAPSSWDHTPTQSIAKPGHKSSEDKKNHDKSHRPSFRLNKLLSQDELARYESGEISEQEVWRRGFEKAFGHTIAEEMYDDRLIEAIKKNPGFTDKMIDMANRGMGEVGDEDDSYKSTVRKYLNFIKHSHATAPAKSERSEPKSVGDHEPTDPNEHGGDDGDDEEIDPNSESYAPKGLLSAAENAQSGKSKTLLRRLTRKMVGLKEGVEFLATQPISGTNYYLTTWMLARAEKEQKRQEILSKLSPEEREKRLRRTARWTTAASLGGGVLYLAVTKGHVTDLMWDSSGSGSGAYDHDVPPADTHDVPPPDGQGGDGSAYIQHDGNNASPDQPGTPDNPQNVTDFNYQQATDPARDPGKHGNDWGTAVHYRPEDAQHGNAAGHTEFFDERVKKSPEEFSATLSEFGLNGKDGTSINQLAEQMANDPKLAESKYDELMKLINSAKVTQMRYDGDYGSYYAVSNPDGSVSLSYDDYVNSASNRQYYGDDWNLFTVYELPNGEKHYAHVGCGYQWSHLPPHIPSPPPTEVVQQTTPTHAQQLHSPPQVTRYSPPPPPDVPVERTPPPPQNTPPPPQNTPPPPIDTPPPPVNTPPPPENTPPPNDSKLGVSPTFNDVTNLGSGNLEPPAPVNSTPITNPGGRDIGGGQVTQPVQEQYRGTPVPSQSGAQSVDANNNRSPATGSSTSNNEARTNSGAGAPTGPAE